MAVQHTAFTPQGFQPGVGGSNITVPSSMQFIEMYNYTQPGQTAKKRLQVEETMRTYINGVAHDTPRTLNLDGVYTYDSEGKMTSVNYPTRIRGTGLSWFRPLGRPTRIRSTRWTGRRVDGSEQ